MSDNSAVGRLARDMTAEIVASYVANNSIRQDDVPGLITAVYQALSALGEAPAPAPAERPTPIVPIKKSITPDYLISLEDGGRYKSLKRHLAGRGLTPADYRTKWGLAADYPMVAENYAKRRSELAKSFGLGRKRAEPEPKAAPSGSRRRGTPEA